MPVSNRSIKDLYTDLANNPGKEFAWDKGLQNALNHGYREEWIKDIPEQIWEYCAATGNPFMAGDFQKGDSVLDLGCGAGVDLCVASLLVGEAGKVFGVDITPAMVEKARSNANLAGLSNITVYEGSIENLSIENDSVKIVISNGVINLASSKEAVFTEIYRVLMNGGHLYFSDMIKDENNPGAVCCENESWADCVAGTLRGDELVRLMEGAGFVNVQLLATNHYRTSPSTIGATFTAMKV